MLSRHLGWSRSFVAGFLLLALTAPSVRAADAEARGATKSANIAFKLDLKQLLESTLVKKYALDDLKNGLAQEKAKEVIKATGVDPLKDITSVNTFVTGIDSPQILISIRGKFDADKINAALAKEAEKETEKFKSMKKGNLTFWEMGDHKGKGPNFTAVVDSPSSILVSTDKEILIKAIETEPKAGSINPDLSAAIKQIPEKNSLWFAVVITDEMKKKVGKVQNQFGPADKIKYITGNLNVADDATFGIQISTTEADAAKELKNTLDQLIQIGNVMVGDDKKVGPVLKEVLNQLQITQVQTTVVVKLVLNEALIKKIAALKP
jgi:hypothetical protein